MLVLIGWVLGRGRFQVRWSGRQYFQNVAWYQMMVEQSPSGLKTRN